MKMGEMAFGAGVMAILVVNNGMAAPTQHEDGGAATYSKDAKAEKPPRIEEVDGKKYYYWPELGQWPNHKLQLRGERTAHPDAQWFPDAGLGLFMHWGIVSEFEPSGEAWSGRWTAKKQEKGLFYPQTEIWAAAETFNPETYNPDKWMAAAKAAGFNYAVLTTKHHDGYALWDSDFAKIGVRQYLNGRDLVKPYVEACRKNGVKVGFYYSGMDWFYDRESMNFSVQPGTMVNYRGEKVDALSPRPADHEEEFSAFNEGQVRELLKFKPDLWWGGCGLDPDKANAPVTIRDHVWYVHARSDMATQQNPVVLKGMARPVSVSLLRTGDELAYEFADQVLKLTVPGDCKYEIGTDVIKLVFDDVANSEPYFFKNR